MAKFQSFMQFTVRVWVTVLTGLSQVKKLLPWQIISDTQLDSTNSVSQEQACPCGMQERACLCGLEKRACLCSYACKSDLVYLQPECTPTIIFCD